MEEQYRRVQEQFGPVAHAYATSPSHSDVAALAELVQLLSPRVSDEVLDVATGAGNLALALAPHVRKVVALDITRSMLEETASRAAERKLSNVETAEAPAEKLPFTDQSFDIVVCRTAPHHFTDVKAFLLEVRRVLRPAGRALIVDTTSPEDEDLARELNEIERIRDPSHVWNYRPSEWRQMIREAGLQIVLDRVRSHALGKRLSFGEWVGRMKVPEGGVSELRSRMMSANMRQLLTVEQVGTDLTFTLPEITLLASRS